MGLFGLAEILKNLEATSIRTIIDQKITRLLPSRQEFTEAAPAIGRGTLIGSILGVLPGGGAVLASFASYTLEKRLSRKPEQFGQGAIAGLAGPESANNAASQTSFIPLLTMGIPSNAVMALMVGAMTIHGIVPGPQFINTHSDLFWGVIVSMWIGNVLLLIINLPLVGVWVQLLRVPYKFMFPAIVLLCCIGIYTVASSPFDLMVTAAFTLLGYVLAKFGYEAAPLLLAFVLGPLLEQYLRRTLQISAGDPSVFFSRPISASILALCLLLVAIAVLPMIRRGRSKVFIED
jgi:putative tricarboxylic transport membrane protein